MAKLTSGFMWCKDTKLLGGTRSRIYVGHKKNPRILARVQDDGTTTLQQKLDFGHNLLEARGVIDQSIRTIQTLLRSSNSLGPKTQEVLKDAQTGVLANGPAPNVLLEHFKRVADGLYAEARIKLVDQVHDGLEGTSKIPLAPYREIPGRASFSQSSKVLQIFADMSRSDVCDRESGALKIVHAIAPAAIGVSDDQADRLARLAVALKEAAVLDEARSPGRYAPEPYRSDRAPALPAKMDAKSSDLHGFYGDPESDYRPLPPYEPRAVTAPQTLNAGRVDEHSAGAAGPEERTVPPAGKEGTRLVDQVSKTSVRSQLRKLEQSKDDPSHEDHLSTEDYNAIKSALLDGLNRTERRKALRGLEPRARSQGGVGL